MAGLRHTRTIIYSTLAAAALLVGALAYPSMVGAAAGPVPPTITATIDSIVPNPAAPGSSAIVTVTYHADGAGPAIEVGVNIEGTNGNGTLSLGTNTSGLTNCHLSGDRAIDCEWTPAGAEDQTLTATINVAAAARDGDSWPVNAVSNHLEIATDQLGIATTTTTTTTSTTEVTTTTVAGVTTTVSGAAAQPAAKPLSLTG